MELTPAERRLAQRLADLRVKKGWSLEILAEHTGISRASLSPVQSELRPAQQPLCLTLCVTFKA